MVFRLAVVAFLVASGCADDPDEDALVWEIVPIGPDPAEVEAFTEGLLHTPEVAAEIGAHRARVLLFELVPGELEGGTWGPTAQFEAVVFDYEANRYLGVRGDLGDADSLRIGATHRLPAPSLDEVDEAVALLLAEDPTLAAEVEAGAVEIFRAMPPLLPAPDGARRIPLGVRDVATGDGREIVGVDLSRREVIRYPGGAPAQTSIDGTSCSPPPSARQDGPGRGVPGWARMRLKLGGEELWSFTLVRPSSSSGTNGSGIELLDVRWRGRPMLARAHVPILNVQYAGDTCGPYRDWQWEEDPFRVGPIHARVGRGIAWVDEARTIRDSREDRGNFVGVAAWVDAAAREAVVTSELAAGWYRYVPEWRFGVDGKLTALWSFDAVRNGCTCRRHVHHAYFRLDFGFGSGVERIEQREGRAPWAVVPTERQLWRDEVSGRVWRVVDPVSGRAVRLVAQPGEDAADAYGVADVWLLRSRPIEVDDAGVSAPIATMAGLSSFVDGESLVDADDVVWWAGHFVHDDADPLTRPSHTVGVQLVAQGW